MANLPGTIIVSTIVFLIICLEIYRIVLIRKHDRQRILDENQLKLAKEIHLRQTLPSKVWDEADDSDIDEVDLENQSERQEEGIETTIVQITEESSKPEAKMCSNTNKTVNGKTSNKKSVKNDCSICLLSFEDGCSTCYSNNPSCSHIFHHECMFEWLMRHDDCPCCRAKYLIETDLI